jgi:FdhE protein
MAQPDHRLHGRVITGPLGDPQQGVRQPAPIILPDVSSLFRRRAERLLSLADHHVMADWLRFMARLAEAQHAAAASTALRVASTESAVAARLPPLSPGRHQRAAAWRDALSVLVQTIDQATLPLEAVRVIADLSCADIGSREELADAYLEGRSDGRTGEALFVAAALQTYFASLAALLPVQLLRLLPQRGLCPVCGSAPVSGVITAAGHAPGARYLHCGLCATAWNHVRAVCINCGGSRSLALHEIDGGNGTVKAETCEECRSYAKMLYQTNDMYVDAMADDLASLSLDMLLSADGWSRSAPNPLVIAA